MQSILRFGENPRFHVKVLTRCLNDGYEVRLGGDTLNVHPSISYEVKQDNVALLENLAEAYGNVARLINPNAQVDDSLFEIVESRTYVMIREFGEDEVYKLPYSFWKNDPPFITGYDVMAASLAMTLLFAADAMREAMQPIAFQDHFVNLGLAV